MIFARIGHGPCYYHWKEIFAGVTVDNYKNKNNATPKKNGWSHCERVIVGGQVP